MNQNQPDKLADLPMNQHQTNTLSNLPHHHCYRLRRQLKPDTNYNREPITSNLQPAAAAAEKKVNRLK